MVVYFFLYVCVVCGLTNFRIKEMCILFARCGFFIDCRITASTSDNLQTLFTESLVSVVLIGCDPF